MTAPKNQPIPIRPLDQFSTSPTGLVLPLLKPDLQCANRAPFFAYKIEGKKWAVVQGCCNDWLCPRCGVMRAKQEYGRIVEGCKQISKETGLRFITITSRGRDMSVKDAEEHYLVWTNRFLDAARQRAKRSGQEWNYVQVTERQKRRHPHSHILTTFNPLDLRLGHLTSWYTDSQGRRIAERKIVLRSDWLQEQVTRSGLGEQYDVSIVETVEGAARYVAKYLFKKTIFTTPWPKRWKRVRYSQNFPRLPERETEAIVLLSAEDWFNLACDAETVEVRDSTASIVTRNAIGHMGVRIIERAPRET